jgi:hypothetical protein
VSAEARIRQMLRVACGVEREGDRHVAEGLRRMAEEFLPVGGHETLPNFECPEN